MTGLRRTLLLCAALFIAGTAAGGDVACEQPTVAELNTKISTVLAKIAEVDNEPLIKRSMMKNAICARTTLGVVLG